MKVKLDENLGRRGYKLLIENGFDVETVVTQNLCSATDRDLINICRIEQRCLITLDFDFSNPLQFPPHKYAGIIVLKPPKDSTAADIIQCLQVFISSVNPHDLAGKLRIVSKSRIREYSP